MQFELGPPQIWKVAACFMTDARLCCREILKNSCCIFKKTWYTRQVRSRSSAGMSVRLTRERSWVRAPLLPFFVPIFTVRSGSPLYPSRAFRKRDRMIQFFFDITDIHFNDIVHWFSSFPKRILFTESDNLTYESVSSFKY